MDLGGTAKKEKSKKLKNVDDLKVIYKDIQGKLSPSITHSQ
jgi:hypothetical protein